MQAWRRKWQSLPRGLVVLITALVIYVPLSFIIIQSFLSAPFFSPSKVFSLEAFEFIFTDPDFYKALKSGFILAFGLVIIAIPLGGILAFLMVRTDLPGRRIIEPLILVPIFVSPMVLGFGYVVAAGPVGFFSLWAQALLGFVPWNIYSMASIVVIAGLTHVPHAYLYISSALRSVGSDVEEAARTAGATPLQVMTAVSLPMVRPSILYAGVLLFFLGLEVFGLMLVLGDPEGNLVLATYLYQLTNKLGTPSYHLMAAVAVVLICITIPLVMLQLRYRQGQSLAGPRAAAGQMALGGRRGGGVLADRDHRRAADRRGAARLYLQLGRGRVSLGRAVDQHLPHHLGAAQPAARHRQLNGDWGDWRGAGGGVLPVHRHRHAPQAGWRHALPRLQRAGAARCAGAAGRSGIPVGVSVPADVVGQIAQGGLAVGAADGRVAAC